MAYAEVAINSPGSGRRLFSYSIPSHLDIQVGHGVWVPFGRQRCLGVVMAITPQPSFTPVKDIEALLLPEPLLAPTQLELAVWMSTKYFCSPFEAAALMLPPGFPQRPRVTYRALDKATAVPPSTPTEALKLWEWLDQHGAASDSAIAKRFGKASSAKWLASLQRSGHVVKQLAWPRIKTAPRGTTFVQLAIGPDTVEGLAHDMDARAPRQAALLRMLATSSDLELTKAAEAAGHAAVLALERKGYLVRRTEPRIVDPLGAVTPDGAPPPHLTPEQAQVVQAITAGLGGGKPSVFLLHGVTGSGKTEVYLQAVAAAAALGKRSIVLVPEISLTPQTLSRFTGRFPGGVAVMHSRLTAVEQLDQWQRVRRGEYQVVVGPRSALFSPQPELGLIILDEEHEWTYKQVDTAPRYHARDVALRLAHASQVVVVLGSATPSMESYYLSQRGDFSLLRLPYRVSRRGIPGALPVVSVVDMREEWKAGNRSLFSRELCAAVSRALAAGEQVILFLNRRGSATTVQCPGCGHALGCRRCALHLTYHEALDALVCHQCNYRAAVPAVCPQCGQRGLRFLGAGTQRVEADAQAQFPGARLLRWDLDVTRGRHDHDAVLRQFLQHEADILVGTQMVAKGLDIPLVSVVGVVSADTQLHVPDFRSSERTFQLLAQVAGRAGRGDVQGTVVVQTFSPQHYAVAAAAAHDFEALYKKELAFRQTRGYPPFSHLIRLLYADAGQQRGQERAQGLARLLRDTRDRSGQSTEVLGPAPAYPPRVRGRYRWYVLLRGQAPETLLDQVSPPPGWTVDVDPVALG